MASNTFTIEFATRIDVRLIALRSVEEKRCPIYGCSETKLMLVVAQLRTRVDDEIDDDMQQWRKGLEVLNCQSFSREVHVLASTRRTNCCIHCGHQRRQ